MANTEDSVPWMCKKCHQTVELKPIKEETKRVWQLTGRKLWSGDLEIIMVPMHPLVKTKLCYHHTKKQEGLYNVELPRRKSSLRERL